MGIRRSQGDSAPGVLAEPADIGQHLVVARLLDRGRESVQRGVHPYHQLAQRLVLGGVDVANAQFQGHRYVPVVARCLRLTPAGLQHGNPAGASQAPAGCARCGSPGLRRAAYVPAAIRIAAPSITSVGAGPRTSISSVGALPSACRPTTKNRLRVAAYSSAATTPNTARFISTPASAEPGVPADTSIGTCSSANMTCDASRAAAQAGQRGTPRPRRYRAWPPLRASLVQLDCGPPGCCNAKPAPRHGCPARRLQGPGGGAY